VLRSATDHTLSNNDLRYGRLTGVLVLGDFERFVFVLSVLERYTDRECSVLLKSSLQEIEETRRRAVQHMAEVDSQCARKKLFESGKYTKVERNQTAGLLGGWCMWIAARARC
jgi:hypothetical protein